ncbi:hypothetical protein V2J09_006703 [Rumex salicifolius]
MALGHETQRGSFLELYWREREGWDWARLSNALLNTILLCLACQELDVDGDSEDVVSWCGAANANFSSKLAYKVTLDPDEVSPCDKGLLRAI